MSVDWPLILTRREAAWFAHGQSNLRGAGSRGARGEGLTAFLVPPSATRENDPDSRAATTRSRLERGILRA